MSDLTKLRKRVDVVLSDENIERAGCPCWVRGECDSPAWTDHSQHAPCCPVAVYNAAVETKGLLDEIAKLRALLGEACDIARGRLDPCIGGDHDTNDRLTAIRTEAGL